MEDEDPLLAPREALEVLETFLDVSEDLDTRAEALNDCRIADTTVCSFLETLDVETRLRALQVSERPVVLATWAEIGTVDERVIVAANPDTPTEALRRLACDPEVEVRVEVAANLSTDLDAIAWLMTDPAPQVQDLLAARFAALVEHCGEEFEVEDEGPGAVTTLDYLYGMVPATEEEDCLDECRASREDGRSASRCDPEPEPDEEPWSLTHAQVLGLLRHRLGARETGPTPGCADPDR